MRTLPIGRRRVLLGLLAAGLAIPAGVARADSQPDAPAASSDPVLPPSTVMATRPSDGDAAVPSGSPTSPVVAPRYVDCALFMLHHTTGPEVADLIARNWDAGRRAVTVGQLGTILLGGASPPAESLFCLSFDDGYRDQFANALPVLARLSCPATLFVMGTGWRGDGVHQYMRPEQIVEAGRLVEIGSHTINHDPNLIALRGRNRGAYMAEIVGSKRQLEDLLGRPVTSFASPASVYDDGVIADVARAGYAFAVMTARDQKRVPTRLTVDDLYQLPRARVT